MIIVDILKLTGLSVVDTSHKTNSRRLSNVKLSKSELREGTRGNDPMEDDDNNSVNGTLLPPSRWRNPISIPEYSINIPEYNKYPRTPDTLP